mgnify:CR=1 FL=1
MRRAAARIALCLLALAAAGGPAHAFDFGRSGDAPIAIDANRGVEWRREERVFIARGNARAERGDVTVNGDVLTAHYRRTDKGETRVHRLEAEGDVVVRSERATAFGDSGVYDVDKGVMVLHGKKLRLETPDQVVTARDSLEYWEKREMAVARGDARMESDRGTLTGDVLTARFRENDAGKRVIRRVDAFGDAVSKGPDGTVRGDHLVAHMTDGPNGRRTDRMDARGHVVVKTNGNIARGERGAYDPQKRMATLAGNVRVTQGESQLNGAYAVINMKTGVSRLYPVPPGEAGDRAGEKAPRVRGLLAPRDDRDAGKAPDASRTGGGDDE